MESIAEQIRARLQGGETPPELIKKGFKKTTVYSVAKKIERKLDKNSDEQSLERDLYLACLVRQAVASLMSDKQLETEHDEWRYNINSAAKRFEDDTGRKPPRDFLTALLTE